MKPSKLQSDQIWYSFFCNLPKKPCEVAVHYNKSLHVLKDFTFQCIDQVESASAAENLDRLLITKEAYWSTQLFSLAPYGLNKRQEFHSKNRINIAISFSTCTSYRIAIISS